MMMVQGNLHGTIPKSAMPDNTTIGGTDLVYGVTLNNNPTVQDLWNTTPAWGYPYSSSPIAPEQIASPLLAGGMADRL